MPQFASSRLSDHEKAQLEHHFWAKFKNPILFVHWSYIAVLFKPMASAEQGVSPYPPQESCVEGMQVFFGRAPVGRSRLPLGLLRTPDS